MIFNPNLCLGCTIDYHSGIEKDKSFNQRVSKNAQELMNVFKTVKN